MWFHFETNYTRACFQDSENVTCVCMRVTLKFLLLGPFSEASSRSQWSDQTPLGLWCSWWSGGGSCRNRCCGSSDPSSRWSRFPSSSSKPFDLWSGLCHCVVCWSWWSDPSFIGGSMQPVVQARCSVLVVILEPSDSWCCCHAIADSICSQWSACGVRSRSLVFVDLSFQ